MNKRESFEYLESLNLNIHRYFIPKDFKEFLELAEELGHFTIRTDSDEHKEELPFFILNPEDWQNSSKLGSIWYDCVVTRKLVLILSDGIKYDKEQLYNMVVKLSKNGDFIFEASDLKIPLRKMYTKPSNLLSVTGSIKESVDRWNIHNNVYGLNRKNLKRKLEEIYSLKLFNKWLELTVYPIKVGKRKEDTVFWQIH